MRRRDYQFAKVDEVVVGHAERKSHCSVWYRYDNVAFATAAERGIPVCNIPDYCIHEVADHTLAFILAATEMFEPTIIDCNKLANGVATMVALSSHCRNCRSGAYWSEVAADKGLKRIIASDGL